jgi:two-component system response regulator YesN
MVFDVMIVDDDNDVHEYLKRIIDWDGLELQIVCEALDGITALELFNKYHPKIIFMDICISNIPGISGLDLTREFRKLDPSVKVIIITGYTDFEYAKEAISLGAIDILSKPLNPSEINTCLIKAISMLEKERNRFLTDSAIEKVINENIDMLRKTRFEYLLKSTEDNNELEIIEQLKLLSIDITSKEYAVANIILNSNKEGNTTDELCHAIIRKLVETKLIENGYKSYSFFSDNLTLNCLIGWSMENGNDYLEELFVNIFDEINSSLNMQIKAGIGGKVESLTKISISALEAEQCLGYCDLEAEPIIDYRNIKDVGELKRRNTKLNPYKKIENYLKVWDYQSIVGIIDELFEMEKESHPSLEELREFSIDYLLLLSKVCTDFNAHLWNTTEFSNVMKQIFTAVSSKMLKAPLLTITYEVLNQIQKRKSQRNEKKNELVVMAKKYVKNHLSDEELGFDEVCDHIGLSKTYFGRLFSREEGESFSYYINKERINYAKTLLSRTNMRVNEIASKSGFRNTKYFSVVFKSLIGISPLEYRRTKRCD